MGKQVVVGSFAYNINILDGKLIQVMIEDLKEDEIDYWFIPKDVVDAIVEMMVANNVEEALDAG